MEPRARSRHAAAPALTRPRRTPTRPLPQSEKALKKALSSMDDGDAAAAAGGEAYLRGVKGQLEDMDRLAKLDWVQVGAARQPCPWCRHALPTACWRHTVGFCGAGRAGSQLAGPSSIPGPGAGLLLLLPTCP